MCQDYDFELESGLLKGAKHTTSITCMVCLADSKGWFPLFCRRLWARWLCCGYYVPAWFGTEGLFAQLLPCELFTQERLHSHWHWRALKAHDVDRVWSTMTWGFSARMTWLYYVYKCVTSPIAKYSCTIVVTVSNCAIQNTYVAS